MSKRKGGQLSIASWCKRPVLTNGIRTVDDDDGTRASNDMSSSCTTVSSDTATDLLSACDPTAQSMSCVSSVRSISADSRTTCTSAITELGRNHASASASIFDAGVYITGGALAGNLDDEIRYKILTQRWLPPADYTMPFSVRVCKGKEEKRYLRRDHLERCPFIGFSPSREGIFCLPCSLFGPASSTAGRSNQHLGKLVTEPLTQFHRLFGKDGYLTTHESWLYHKSAVVRSDQFCARFSAGSTIAEDVDTASCQQAAENRRRLTPIVKTILLCARQNIALRGHRDDGSLLDNNDGAAVDTSVVRKDGNFRALLKFRIDSGDGVLKQHLESATSNATYVSKTTQNELIKAAGDVVRQKILDRVAAARFFTILADETMDVSRCEMMSLCVRYLLDKSIREDFLDFIPVYDLTGE